MLNLPLSGAKECITRVHVIKGLSSIFVRVNSDLERAKVSSNGQASRCFHIAQGLFGLTVVFTEKRAQDVLERVTKAIKGDLESVFQEVVYFPLDIVTSTTLRNDDADEVMKDVEQTSLATAVLTAFHPKHPLKRYLPFTMDGEMDGVDDEVSQWDEESMDSAEVGVRCIWSTHFVSGLLGHRIYNSRFARNAPTRQVPLATPLRMLLRYVCVFNFFIGLTRLCLALAPNPSTPRFVGFDLGTSGARISIIEPTLGQDYDEVFSKALTWSDCGAYDDAEAWYVAIECLLKDAAEALDDGLVSVRRICVSGTSASCLVMDRTSHRVTRPARMYDYDILSSASSKEEKQYAEKALECIRKHVPSRHTATARTGSLAKLLSWAYESEWKDFEVLCHQSDFVSMRLMETCSPVKSDWHNCLKLGYDVRNKCWPSWMEKCLLDVGIQKPLDEKAGVIPFQVVSPGEPLGAIGKSMAQRLGLSEDTLIVGGTTDSNAAFFSAAGICPTFGTAVTSLGSTTAIKLLSQQYLEDADRGVYSHRFPSRGGDDNNEAWLVGGASNVGCAVFRLLDFGNEELVSLSEKIDPLTDSPMHYYPLVKIGERFPNADSNKRPLLDPVPDSRQEYLHGLLQSISMVEMEGFRVLHDLGAPLPKVIFSCGGGSKNPIWTQIRRRMLVKGLGVSDISMERATGSNVEASYGAALLAAATALYTPTLSTNVSHCQQDR
jgi:D-ribulokinase